MKNIVVLGGGTAGWFTALFAKKLFYRDRVTLVESEDIGILGAGEGSTPTLIDFLKYIEIPYRDLIKNTNSTFKLGIKFDNWNGDNKSYFHPFGIHDNRFTIFHAPPYLDESDILSYKYNHGFELFFKNVIGKGAHIDDFAIQAIFAKYNKSPFVESGKAPTIGFSMHFDARNLAEYCRKIAEGRGVQRIEGKLTTVENNETGEITAINIDSGQRLPVDFIFDCTGFARMLISKHYKTPWKDYSDHLPVNSAIPFFPKANDQYIESYTLARAMKYGWMWKIPLQHRYGAGYVFDDRLVSHDEAKREVDELMGYEVESPRTFKFTAGRFEKVWVKNCMAVGLASGFTEPLEATSIWQAMTQLLYFRAFYNDIGKYNKNQDVYNETIARNNDDTLNFLYLHYKTKRSDTEFWKEFSNRTKSIPIIDSVLKAAADGTFCVNDFQLETLEHKSCSFQVHSYYYILAGLEHFNRQAFKEYTQNLELDKILRPNLQYYLKMQAELLNYGIDHKLAIEKIIKDEL
jgi:tryptophan halogenase